MPKLRLVKTYREKLPMREIHWELERTITDKNQVKQAFASRAQYQTTDYADVGDNESDPFLMNMINLGFVEHGASGFYDSNGHALDGQHH